MKQQSTYRATDREAWRVWLEKNHASQKEVWVLFPKKHTGQSCMSYEDSVEEALCWGWIDSIIKRIDDATFARKFTPRTDHQNWSELNKKRLAKCMKEGRMTAAGLAKIKYSDAQSSPRPQMPRVITVPSFIATALKKNPEAWRNFNALAPSHRRRYLIWITMAKQEETRQRRLKEAIRLLERNEKLGLK